MLKNLLTRISRLFAKIPLSFRGRDRGGVSDSVHVVPDTLPFNHLLLFNNEELVKELSYRRNVDCYQVPQNSVITLPGVVYKCDTPVKVIISHD
ncbi:MAG: hypothetical protein RDU76_06135 [Candidatus Edwardsbacteria bacterium]|nr:hypothetical protein [Candidatus Edwardsbacteria bacterium]